MSVDPRAINYVLGHPVEYEKPPVTQRLLSSLIGSGTIMMFTSVQQDSTQSFRGRFTCFRR